MNRARDERRYQVMMAALIPKESHWSPWNVPISAHSSKKIEQSVGSEHGGGTAQYLDRRPHHLRSSFCPGGPNMCGREVLANLEFVITRVAPNAVRPYVPLLDELPTKGG